ncbi:HD-GYP domain-containing protein [Deinococcus peraridilitoris]|uniref:HD-GYP domain-containing protein n=1 Tax=Deinococcus peraridilitoris TaxID=432329 RepID=UPI0002EA4DEA|nr:HD-GYP domain-containing protein [Deinococcus peraridilitoris]
MSAKSGFSDELDRALNGLIRQLWAHDPDTAQHASAVTALGQAVGRHLDLAPGDAEALELGAQLHDIGKLLIPEEVLRKREPLSELEWQVMRAHCEYGHRLASSLPQVPAGVLEVVLFHHERWNGTGYPVGRRGRDTPFLARVLAVCDVYDALTGERAYKLPWTSARTLAYLRENAAILFDPTAVEALESLCREREHALFKAE